MEASHHFFWVVFLLFRVVFIFVIRFEDAARRCSPALVVAVAGKPYYSLDFENGRDVAVKVNPKERSLAAFHFLFLKGLLKLDDALLHRLVRLWTLHLTISSCSKCFTTIINLSIFYIINCLICHLIVRSTFKLIIWIWECIAWWVFAYWSLTHWNIGFGLITRNLNWFLPLQLR